MSTTVASYNRNKTNGNRIAVKIPAIPIQRPAIAPSSSPISRARDVPTAWLAVPRHTPTAIGSLIFTNFMNGGARIAPRMPVRIMMAAEIAGIPPNCADRSIPMAVVIALGIIETDNACSKWNSFTNITIDSNDARVPAKIPIIMALKLDFNTSSCS